MDAETTASARPQPLRRATFAVRVTLPVLAFLALVLSPFLVFGDRGPEISGILVAYILPPAGKETVMPLMIGKWHVSPLMTAIYVGGLDMIMAWFLAWNWDLVTRIPKVGARIARLMKRGRAWFDRHPSFEGSAFVGLAIYVFLPGQGTGAIGGTALGRLVGMPAQRAWVAIMIGAMGSALAFAYSADATRELIVRFGWEAVLVGTILVMSVAAFLVLTYRRFAGA